MFFNCEQLLKHPASIDVIFSLILIVTRDLQFSKAKDDNLVTP